MIVETNFLIEIKMIDSMKELDCVMMSYLEKLSPIMMMKMKMMEWIFTHSVCSLSTELEAKVMWILTSVVNSGCVRAANVFGKAKKNTEFMPYSGDGFKLNIPSKWNPSKEVEYPGQVLRYEDNFDSTSNLAVMVTPTDKKSITDYGSPEEFLSQVILSC